MDRAAVRLHAALAACGCRAF